MLDWANIETPFLSLLAILASTIFQSYFLLNIPTDDTNCGGQKNEKGKSPLKS